VFGNLAFPYLIILLSKSKIIMKTYQQSGKNQKLFILNHKTSKKVFVNSIVLLKGNINYTIVHLVDGKTKVIAHSIKFFEPFLETHGFLRTHRAFLVNPEHISAYNQVEEVLMMSNGQKVNISRRRKNVVKNLRNIVD
jgi:DNA-binding LytR/AlgR family response regulator